MSTETKTRNRDPLGKQVHEERSAAPSQSESWYLTKKARTDRNDKDLAISNFVKAKTAIDYRWHWIRQEAFNAPDYRWFAERRRGRAKVPKALQGWQPPVREMTFERKEAIAYFYHTVYGSPPVNTWKDTSLVSSIMYDCNINTSSRSWVQSILQDIVASDAAGEAYSPIKRLKDRGRNATINENSEDAKYIYAALSHDLSIAMATIVVNIQRNERGLDPVSFSTVQRFCERSDVIDISKRYQKKSGKDDEETAWAHARLNQCNQYLRQLEAGSKISNWSAVGQDNTFVKRIEEPDT